MQMYFKRKVICLCADENLFSLYVTVPLRFCPNLLMVVTVDPVLK